MAICLKRIPGGERGINLKINTYQSVEFILQDYLINGMFFG
jgi:hypothetical protein